MPREAARFDPGNPTLEPVLERLESVVIGKRRVAERMLCAVLAQGHVLLEDVPGVGKTLLAKTLARCLDFSFARVQFTPDLLPSDLIGVHIWDPRDLNFHFRPGPLFHQLVLADEINRASPRTQSALLEAMEEGQTTVEGSTYPLPRPFLVVATENSLDDAGTFPLPEAQLDRFMFRLHLGYPTLEEEVELLRLHSRADALPQAALLALEVVLGLQKEARAVRVTEPVLRYVAQLIQATREHPGLALGASPRAAVALAHAAQAWAFMQGRRFVIPDDVRLLLPDVLEHRLLLKNPHRGDDRARVSEVLQDILREVPVPTGESR